MKGGNEKAQGQFVWNFIALIEQGLLMKLESLLTDNFDIIKKVMREKNGKYLHKYIFNREDTVNKLNNAVTLRNNDITADHLIDEGIVIDDEMITTKID